MNLKDYIQLNKNKFDDKKIASKADNIFKKRLKLELHKPKKGKLVYLKYVAIAASFILLITLSINFINIRKQEKNRTQLLANLGNDSAGKRLEAIYLFDDNYTKEDQQIIKTLLSILHTDNNANVKIATTDALLKFPNNDLIRTNLITALENEKITLVQIKLIKSLSILRENRAHKPLMNLIKNQKTIPIVLSNATLAIAELNQKK